MVAKDSPQEKSRETKWRFLDTFDSLWIEEHRLLADGAQKCSEKYDN